MFHLTVKPFYILSNYYPFLYLWKKSVKQSLNPIIVYSKCIINTWLSFMHLTDLI